MRLHRLASPELGRVFRGETVSGLSEWQLLERYLEARDESAFEALVSRHGPMVLGVCRRMLRDSADVNDAFQATFLVLVRRAKQLGPRDAIGPWLYGVASRVALRARAKSARHRQFGPVAPELPAVEKADARVDPELGELLDQELSRLPSKYRSPLVLCYLEGRTHEEAARELKWPVGTVKGRLSRARDLLRSRLIRRGMGPAAGALASLLASEAKAAIERPLLERTVRSSLKVAGGQSVGQVVSSSITSLAEGMLTTMILDQFKWTTLGILVAGLALTSAGVMARQDARLKSNPPTTTSRATVGKVDSNPVGDHSSPDKKSEGDTIAIAKAIDLEDSPADARQQLVQAERAAYQATWEAFRGGHASAEQLHDLSGQWMEAQDEGPGSTASVTAAMAHHERMRDLLRFESDRPSSPSKAAEVARVKAYVSEARFGIAQAKARWYSGLGSTQPGEQGAGQDPRSMKIIAKLEEPISMSFANETPLDDVLKYIKQATTTSTFSGIPIYVDPTGLQEAERSLNSTVQMDLEGIPLRRTLQLLLAQLELAYYVEDGILHITSQDSADQFALTRKPSQIMSRVERATRGELTLDEMKQLIEELKIRETVMKLGAGDPTKAEREPNEGDVKRNHEQMALLVKEMREVIELLKSQKTPAGK